MADDTDVERRIETMQRELDELRAELLAQRGTPPAAPTGRASRRQLLSRGAIAAGAGAVGAVLSARPAAAAGTNPVELGAENTTAGSTRVTASGSLSDALFGEATSSASNSNAWGVRGETASPNGFGVFGRNNATTGIRPVGVKGVTSSDGGTGVEGTVDFLGASPVPASLPIGVHGHVAGLINATGVKGEVTSTDSESAGVFGVTNDAGWGVIGAGGDEDESGGGVWGLCSDGAGVGVSAVNSNGGVGLNALSLGGLGAVVTGTTAALRLGASTGVPTARTEAHEFGELYVDQATRNLWYCTKSGTPGTWINLSSPPPLLRPVTPFRVYDSRFTGGTLRLGSTRTVSVRHSIDLESGARDVTDAVPAGATAVTFNLTVFGTTGAGFVAATPGGAVSFGTATVNWSGPSQVVGNATLVNLDASRRMKVFIGGTPGASVGFTVDVTGYLA